MKIDYITEFAVIMEIIQGGLANIYLHTLCISKELKTLCENNKREELNEYRQRLIKRGKLDEEWINALQNNDGLRFIILTSLHDYRLVKVSENKENNCVLMEINADNDCFPIKYSKNQKFTVSFYKCNSEKRIFNKLNNNRTYIIDVYDFKVEDKIKLKIDLEIFNGKTLDKEILEIICDKIDVCC